MRGCVLSAAPILFLRKIVDAPIALGGRPRIFCGDFISNVLLRLWRPRPGRPPMRDPLADPVADWSRRAIPPSIGALHLNLRERLQGERPVASSLIGFFEEMC